MKQLDWYFDFISPYAYLQSERLSEFGLSVNIRCVPVLFAGLLEHWGQKGPAEITGKRIWTYEHVTWLAHRDGIALCLPSAHPFNPLPLLRLSLVLGNRLEVVQRLFRWVWVQGHIPQNAPEFAALLTELGVSAGQLQTDDVKQGIRRYTEEAIAAGVFGVPSCRVNDRLIWGYESNDMVRAAIADDPFLQSAQMLAARSISTGTQRKGVQV